MEGSLDNRYKVGKKEGLEKERKELNVKESPLGNVMGGREGGKDMNKGYGRHGE